MSGRDAGEMVSVTAPSPLELAGRPHGAEPPHREQHPEPVGRVVELQQAGVDERSDGVGHLVGRLPVAAHCDRRVQRERRLEHGQPDEH